MEYWIDCLFSDFETKEILGLYFSNQTWFDLKSINGK